MRQRLNEHPKALVTSAQSLAQRPAPRTLGIGHWALHRLNQCKATSRHQKRSWRSVESGLENPSTASPAPSSALVAPVAPANTPPWPQAPTRFQALRGCSLACPRSWPFLGSNCQSGPPCSAPWRPQPTSIARRPPLSALRNPLLQLSANPADSCPYKLPKLPPSFSALVK